MGSRRRKKKQQQKPHTLQKGGIEYQCQNKHFILTKLSGRISDAKHYCLTQLDACGYIHWNWFCSKLNSNMK